MAKTKFLASTKKITKGDIRSAFKELEKNNNAQIKRILDLFNDAMFRWYSGRMNP